MSKFALLLFGILFTFGCKVNKPQITYASVDNGLEPGGCYFSLKNLAGDSEEDAFLIEIEPLIYSRKLVEFSANNLNQYKYSNGKHQYQAAPAKLEFVMSEDSLEEFTTVANPVGYMYCLVEHSPRIGIITDEELKSANNKVVIFESNQSRIIKTHVKEKPSLLNDNQYFFESGYWSEIMRASASSF